MIATEAYKRITSDIEDLMRLILHVVLHGDTTDYLAGLIGGELMGIYRAWCIAGGVLLGYGDEIYLLDMAKLKRLTRGEV